MLFSKNTINSKDWMDVIFAERNKDYGAYYLRQYASKATNIALLVVLCTVGGFCSLSFMERKNVIKQSVSILQETTLVEVELAVEEPKSFDVIKDENPSQVAQDVSVVDLVKFTEIKPSPKPATEDIASAAEVMDKKVLLASLNMKGVKGGELIPKGTFGKIKREGGAVGRSVGDATGSGIDQPFVAAEIMPMPPGGMAAFVKWVALNYKFSESAVQNEAQGLVQITFVVEKDGSLSSFDVKRDIGYGTGEEAIRLLQKARRWDPGIQNGIPVRVSYTLPIRLSTIAP